MTYMEIDYLRLIKTDESSFGHSQAPDDTQKA